jgi:hypothetical protein
LLKILDKENEQVLGEKIKRLSHFWVWSLFSINKCAWL